MKKITCCMLIMTVILSSISALAYSDISNSKYKDNIELLTKYNIVSGDDDRFRPSDNLTRAEAAKIMLYACNINESDLSLTFDENESYDYIVAAPIEQHTVSYSDITPSHWGYNYIMYASQGLNLLSGFSDGSIRPDDYVTYSQFLTMAVRAIGYESYAEDIGGYPLGYYNVSKILNITGGIENIELEMPITREAAAQIVFHMINVPVRSISTYDFSLGEGVAQMKILDGTDGTERTTLLSNIQKNNRLIEKNNGD